MPRGRGIYQDESRDKLQPNIDADDEDDRRSRDYSAHGGESPEPKEPPD